MDWFYWDMHRSASKESLTSACFFPIYDRRMDQRPTTMWILIKKIEFGVLDIEHQTRQMKSNQKRQVLCRFVSVSMRNDCSNQPY